MATNGSDVRVRSNEVGGDRSRTQPSDPQRSAVPRDDRLNDGGEHDCVADVERDARNMEIAAPAARREEEQGSGEQHGHGV
jgi:hypothetical protein